MTLNELSRFYWARMNQASYIDGAINRLKCGDEVDMWHCLLNWVYYKDIADTIEDTYGYIEMTVTMIESQGETEWGNSGHQC